MLIRCNPFDKRCAALALLACLTTSGWAQTTGDRDEFLRSVTDGRIEIVKAGVRQHPDWANSEYFLGLGPVYRASVLGREEIVAVLLAAGAEVNATTDRGTHPLHAAAQHGYPGIVDRLLNAGAEPDPKNDFGQTPLFMAVRFGHPDIAERLVSKGASLTTTDALGRTPLHYAAGLGRADSVRMLLDNGADAQAVDLEGYTPLGLCRSWKRNDFKTADANLTARGATDLRPPSAWAREQAEIENPAAPGAGQPATKPATKRATKPR